MRPPSVRCTLWNRMSFSSVAEYSFTAIDTSPKDTAPFQIARIATPFHQLLFRPLGSRIPSSRPRCEGYARSIVDCVPGTPYAPMLATAGELPVGGGWAYELKWDGVRAIAAVSPDAARLYARRGPEITVAYPELR